MSWETADPIETAADAYLRTLKHELQTIIEAEFTLPERPAPLATEEATLAALREYDRTVDQLRASQERRQKAAARAFHKLDCDPCDWPAIYAAESELIGVVDDTRLRRRAWFIRDRFTEVAGSDKAARYLASGAPDIQSANSDDIRADLSELHREMTYQLIFRRQAERERARLLRTVSNWTLVIVAVFAAFVAWQSVLTLGKVIFVLIVISIAATELFRRVKALRRRKTTAPSSVATVVVLAFVLLASTARAAVDLTTTAATASVPQTSKAAAENPTIPVPDDVKKKWAEEDLAPNNMPSLAFAAIAGLLGAAFSLMQRVQRSESSDPQIALFSFHQAGVQTFLISSLCGLISAIAIYAVFAGDMVSGVLFPKIVNGAAARDGFAFATLRFLRMSGPATVADHAKLLVWAFIGGFSERFLPDILDRFVKSSNK